MSGTVTVACKLPNGLILRGFRMDSVYESVMGGGQREVKIAHEVGEPVYINGNAHLQNEAPNCEISNGAALTHGVDKDFWDLWLSQNKDHLAVKNGLIFAHEKPVNATAEAREKAGVKSGLERLDPSNLPKGIKPFAKEAA
jgi:hypothetical protein